MDALFEKLDDVLYEQADKSNTNQLQTPYFDALRLLRKHRTQIQDGFLRAVLADFDHFWTQGPQDLSLQRTPPPTEDEGLSLVGEDELEESLAVTNLVSKGENHFRRELYALDRRFGALLGDIDVESHSNPVGPAGICARFHDAIQGLTLDTPLRLVVYKLFDRQVLQYVGGLYEEINALLGRAGVNPKPAARIRDGIPRPSQRSDQTAREGAPAGYARGPGSGPRMEGGRYAAAPSGGGFAAPAGYYGDYAREVGAFQADLFHTLQELLETYWTARGGRGVPFDVGLPTVGRSELIGALSRLQHEDFREALQEELLGRVELRVRLADLLSLQQEGKAKRTLERADEDTLDVIAMIFDFLLTGPNLPDALKALIARLQIPMLKVAILDKAFFSAKLHPARRLLNNLARAATGWSDDGDRSTESLYGHIESIVNRVVTTFEEDPSVFEQLSEELCAYLDRERRGAEIREQRTNQVTQGKEQLRVAKEQVAAEMRGRLQEQARVPLVVRTLLEDGWKDVLLLTNLRQGRESDAWKEQLGMADRLLWSVQPKTSHQDRQELLRAIPDLLRQLREGLNGISYDQHRMGRLLKELQSCHLACLRGIDCSQEGPFAFQGAVQMPEGAARSPEPLVDEEDRAVRVPTSSGVETIEQDRFSELVEEMAVGTWLEMQEDEGRQMRVKLSWKSDVNDSYVFVNRKGVKVLEMTMAGVARLLRRDKAKLLGDVEAPIMDRALDAMLATLQKSDPVHS
jgi:hypothetical protein